MASPAKAPAPPLEAAPPVYVNKRLEATKRQMKLSAAVDGNRRFIFIPKSTGESSLKNASPKPKDDAAEKTAAVFATSKEGAIFSPVTDEELRYLEGLINQKTEGQK